MVTSYQILLLRFCTNFFPITSLDSSVCIVIRLRDGSSGFRIPEWARVFFFSNRSARLWGPPSFLFVGYRGYEWVGLYLYSPPYAFLAWTGTFHIFHMSATCSAHHVIMRLLCSVKVPSFKRLPPANSRLHRFSRHTTHLHAHILLARPTMLHCLLW